jgi:hypothetical protein
MPPPIGDGIIRVARRAMAGCVSVAALAMLLVACGSPAAPGVSQSPPIADAARSSGPSPTSNGTLLAIDTFTVIEYRPACAWACPYLIYAPLIKLREPTGKASVEVVSVEYTLGSKTTGVCRGSVVYGPGSSSYLDGIYEYPWENDLIFVSLDGTPLPGDVATAHLVVRSADGATVKLDATAPIQRMVSNPSFPAPRANSWLCS